MFHQRWVGWGWRVHQTAKLCEDRFGKGENYLPSPVCFIYSRPPSLPPALYANGETCVIHGRLALWIWASGSQKRDCLILLVSDTLKSPLKDAFLPTGGIIAQKGWFKTAQPTLLFF